jgi:hypothetical protein
MQDVKQHAEDDLVIPIPPQIPSNSYHIFIEVLGAVN